MIVIQSENILDNIRKNIAGRRYPESSDKRFRDGMIQPHLTPSFKIKQGTKIFTIGSCFARNIETFLTGHELPTRHFSLPEGEIVSPIGNRVLNEYNPGSLAQRISNAALKESFGEKAIFSEDTGVSDLLLAGGVPVTKERLIERREQIDSIYREMNSSQILIITLGLVEAWYDKDDKVYLNRIPGSEVFKKAEIGKRYELRILDVDDSYALMSAAIELALTTNLSNIIVTVSPVPLQTTFSKSDALVANSYSKATLRCVADRLSRSFVKVEYFPSYEMVTTYSENPFLPDNVHVKAEVVKRVIDYMLKHYEEK